MTQHDANLVVSSNMADLEFYQDDSDLNNDDGYGYDRLCEIEDLTPLQKLEKYIVSDNMFNRQMLARGLLDTLRAVHDQDDDCAAVLEAMSKLSEDPEPTVRSELMEQVPHIAVYCKENRESFADAMPGYILPMVVRYLNESNCQVRKTSQAALLVLMEQALVEKSDVEEQVVKVILELASPESLDDYRSEAAALMSKMAPLLGTDITERYFLPRFSEMCTDPLFHVRKVCATNFGEVSNVVGVKNCEEILLPKFFFLCEDGVWGVRKACAECFMTVSCACSLETRRNELANLFVNLLCDQSRWVRMSAFQYLGPFISTFADYGISCSLDETGQLESFSIEDYEKQRDESPSDLQGILQLKSLDSSNFGESDTDPAPDQAIGCERLDEAMEVEEDLETDNPSSLESGDNSAFPEKSFEELRAQSLSPGFQEDSLDKLKTLSISHGASDDSNCTDLKPLDINNDVYLDSNCDKDKELATTEPTSLAPLVSLPCDSSEDSRNVSDSSCTTPVQDSPAISSSDILDCTNSASTAATTSVIPEPSKLDAKSDNTFNNFQYWRSPLPEVTIDFDLISAKPGSIHVVEKLKNYSAAATKSDLVQNSATSDCLPLTSHLVETSSKNAVSDSLSKFTSPSSNIQSVHTAALTTPSQSADSFLSIGSSHSMASRFGERHFSVLDAVQDYSNSIGFMDDLPSLLDMVLDDATLAQQQNIVPQLLLENYLGMVDPSRAQTVDSDITKHCAYNLPAVAQTLGRRNWHCIKQLYETLAQDMQWKVRRTLAFSIHELAQIVGDEITHKDLVPIFDGFLKDLDEVRIGVLKHLADIFKLLRREVRVQYLSRVHDFMKTDNTRNWRFREELAEQLVSICDLFYCQEIVEHVVPVALVLCLDKVAQVRTMSLKLLSSILQRTHQDKEKKLLASICNDLIERFATNYRWLGRQTFAQLCYVILEEDSLPPAEFARNLLPSLLALSTDSVANVRLSVAKVLAERITPLDYFTSQSNPHHSDLVETLHRLRQDTDKDVRYFSSLQPKTDLSQHHPTVPV